MATQPEPLPAGSPTRRRRPPVLLWVVFAVVILALVVVVLGPDRLVALLPGRAKAHAPMALTVLHTNDTWGYLLPCG
jgi:hypothetical protein